MSGARSTGRRNAKSAVATNLARKPEASSYEIAARLGVIGCDRSPPGPVAANAKAEARRAIRAKRSR